MAADPLLKAHLVGVMNEVLRLAEKVLKSPLPSKFATPEQIIKSTLRNTSKSEGEASRPSMWYDWAGGKPLELEVILGNVVREAERVGMEIPRVQSMYALLCMAQKRRDNARNKTKL
jgi:2-dehydropantoate 2-reductase